MRFQILGPVCVRRDGEPVAVGGARERFLLASLLLSADRTVSADGLIDMLWRTPPRTARAQLHNAVSRLRRRLESAGQPLVSTRPGGYELRLDGHSLDLLDFRALVRRATEASANDEQIEAERMLSSALDLWQGPALADVDDHLLIEDRARLSEERLAASEAALHVTLTLGRFDAAARTAEAMSEAAPYRERVYELQMHALIGAGRRVEALDVYQRAYRVLTTELGVEPGKLLRTLQQNALRGDDVSTVARSVRPCQLPAPAPVLIGRDALLDEVSGLLAAPPTPDPVDQVGPVGLSVGLSVGLLVGPSGVGKTTLAVAAGHRAGSAYPDGQLYADLRGNQSDPADPYDVAGRFLRALGTPGRDVPQDSEERFALFRSQLAEARMLIVLDDAGSEAGVRPLLPAGPGCGVLVTSRRKLAGLVGVARWTVPLLSAADAVDLLGRIIGPERVAAEVDGADRIAVACGRLPLALSVVAARLALRPDWTLAELLERIEDERGRLDEFRVGDLDVRASIQLSYDQLPPDARRLLRLLAASGAADCPAWVIRELTDDRTGPLDDLLDAHLVESLGRDSVDQPRYRLHDLVAAFARERARTEDGEDQLAELTRRVLAGWLGAAAVADEHVRHGMSVADDLEAPDPPPELVDVVENRAREWFEVERAGLVSAVEQAAGLGAVELAGSLALRLYGFLAVRMYGSDQERVLRVAVEQAREHGPDSVLLRLLHAEFQLHSQQSNYAAMSTLISEQVAVADRVGDSTLKTKVLNQGAFALACAGRIQESARLAEDAIAIGRTNGYRDLASVLMFRADLFVDMAEAERGLPLCEEGVELSRRRGRDRRHAIDLHLYGRVLTEVGRIDDAERVFAEITEIVREIDDQLGLAHVELGYAEIDVKRGDWDAAGRRLDSVVERMSTLGDRLGLATAYRLAADVATARRAFDEATELLDRAMSTWREIGDPLQIARLYARLGRVHAAAGNVWAAARARTQWSTRLEQLELDERCLLIPPHYP